MFHVEHFDKISPSVREKFEIYKVLLYKWQRAINLVSDNSLDDFWRRHIEDSLQIIPYIRGKKVLDVGSGGGFPGMVLAITGNFDVTCVDSDSRKMMFLSEVTRQTDTKVTLLTERIEKVIETDFDTVCARGFSGLKNLIKIAADKSGYGVFLKGAKIEEEIREAQKLYDFTYKLYPSKTDSSGHIITVSVERNKCHESTTSR